MKIAATAMMFLLSGASSWSVAQDTATGTTGGDRRADMRVTAPEFVKKAGAAGMAEVEMGTLGAQKATNADVKAFAKQMVSDHTKANKELATVAQAKNLEVPSSPDMMHKGMMKKLESQSADKDFDRDFMQQMVKDHKAVLQQHMKDAQALETKLAK
jgi:putative membrane protein